MVLALILLSLGFSITIFEKFIRKKDGDSEYDKFPPLVRYLLLGIQILTFFVGGYLLIQSDADSRHEKEDLRAKALRDSIELQKKWTFDTTRLKQIIDSSELIIQKNNENLNQSNKVLGASNTAIKRADDIYKNLTGGESYCYIDLSFYVRTNQPVLSLIHSGKIVLRNISITIDDLGRRVFLIDNVAHKDYSSPLVSGIIKSTMYGQSYPALYPNTSTDISIPIEQGQKDISLMIWIQLDNGLVFETLEAHNIYSDKRTGKYEVKRGNKLLKKYEIK